MEMIVEYQGKPPLRTMPKIKSELVRCKDCKRGSLDEYGYVNCDRCETHEPDWFCADGERKFVTDMNVLNKEGR